MLLPPPPGYVAVSGKILEVRQASSGHRLGIRPYTPQQGSPTPPRENDMVPHVSVRLGKPGLNDDDDADHHDTNH